METGLDSWDHPCLQGDAVSHRATNLLNVVIHQNEELYLQLFYTVHLKDLSLGVA